MLGSISLFVMTPSNQTPKSLDKHFAGPAQVPLIGAARPGSTMANSPSDIQKIGSIGHQSDNIRVDSPHGRHDEDASLDSQDQHSNKTNVDELVRREGWLRLHATDLIRRLQDWASGLDAREATLNAAYARQDLRERKFRLHQQEIETQIAAHKQAAEDLRQRINASLRRLAFRNLETPG